MMTFQNLGDLAGPQSECCRTRNVDLPSPVKLRQITGAGGGVGGVIIVRRVLENDVPTLAGERKNLHGRADIGHTLKPSRLLVEHHEPFGGCQLLIVRTDQGRDQALTVVLQKNLLVVGKNELPTASLLWVVKLSHEISP